MVGPSEFGRFAEAARLVLVALGTGPRAVTALFDELRTLDGPIGPGTFYAAIARLEQRGLIAPETASDGRRAYRLTDPHATAGQPGGAR
jgi:DNA-binding PadR family transcriptional regulator